MAASTFVLIPGAGGGAWFWHRVVPLLPGRGHEALAVDLPAADDACGLPEYRQAVVDAVGDRSGVVVVAQSMGAFVVPMLSPEVDISRIVLLNAMVPLPGETPGAWWENTGSSEAKAEMDVREGREPGGFDLMTYFFHDVPPDVVEEAFTHDARQSDTVFGSVCAFEAWPDVPISVLSGRDDRFFPLEFQRRVALDRLGLPVEEVPGGHLAALAHPDELTGRLAEIAGG